jgi:hypothetical protein
VLRACACRSGPIQRAIFEKEVCAGEFASHYEDRVLAVWNQIKGRQDGRTAVVVRKQAFYEERKKLGLSSVQVRGRRHTYVLQLQPELAAPPPAAEAIARVPLDPLSSFSSSSSSLSSRRGPPS